MTEEEERETGRDRERGCQHGSCRFVRQEEGEVGSFMFAQIDHDPDLSCSFQNKHEGHSLPLPLHMKTKKRMRAYDGDSLSAYGIAVVASRQERGQQ